MANIDNKLGTNGAYGGRTSVEAFNDVLSAFNGAGVLSGWKAEPAGGLSVILGGDGENRDVAIALDNQGNKTTVNNISKQPITITLPSAPASGTRKDNIVAYIDKPAQADDTTLDNPSAVNIFITSADTDNAIRSAITQDGGVGANAFYVVLASVNLSAGTTDITADMIEQGTKAKIGSQNIDFAYQSGDDIRIGLNKFGYGFLTSGQKDLNLTIPIQGTQVEQQVNLTKCELQVRGLGYYVNPTGQNSQNIDYIASSDLRAYEAYINEVGLNISLHYNTTLKQGATSTACTNNTPVSVNCLNIVGKVV